MNTASREYLDGPRLVKWLEAEGLKAGESRAFNRWKAGAAATVYAADRFLTKRGLHIHLLPDDLWIDPPSGEEPKSGKRARTHKTTMGVRRGKGV